MAGQQSSFDFFLMPLTFYFIFLLWQWKKSLQCIILKLHVELVLGDTEKIMVVFFWNKRIKKCWKIFCSNLANRLRQEWSTLVFYILLTCSWLLPHSREQRATRITVSPEEGMEDLSPRAESRDSSSREVGCPPFQLSPVLSSNQNRLPKEVSKNK